MIRGARNPFPAITKMRNSGIFSNGTEGQKMDKAAKMPAGVARAVKEAYSCGRKNPLGGGMSARKVQSRAMNSTRKTGRKTG